MSDAAPGSKDRLLAHLLATSDESERREIELAVLEDDELFDQLRAAEIELIDSYVRGDLDEPVAQRLAELVGRSRRLQESAETTLALSLRERGLLAAGSTRSSSAPTAESESARPARSLAGQGHLPAWLCGLALTLTLLALWQVASLRQDLGQARAELEALRQQQSAFAADRVLLEREIERLRAEQLRLERHWAASQAPGR